MVSTARIGYVKEFFSGDMRLWLASRSSSFIVVTLTILAVAVRLYGITAKFWYDEQFTWLLSTLSFEKMLIATRGDVHPSLFYVFVWMWSKLFGHSEIALRMVTLAPGVALVPATFWLGQIIGLEKRANYLAMSFATFSLWTVYYSQELRMYSWLMLLLPLAICGALTGRWWLLAICSLAMLYLHNISAVFVAWLFLIAFIFDRKWQIIATGLITAVGFMPGLFNLLYQKSNLDGGYWIPALPYFGLPRLMSAFADMSFFVASTPFLVSSSFISACLIVLVVDDLVNLRANKKIYFIALLLFGPAATLIIISLVWQPVLISRMLAPTTLLFYLLIGWTASRTPSRWQTIAPIVLLNLAIVLTSWHFNLNRFSHEQEPLRFNEKDDLALYQIFNSQYIETLYLSPKMKQYVYGQGSDLKSSGLSLETMTALGMNIANFEDVVCEHKTWYIKFIDIPGYTTEEKFAYLALLKDNFVLKIYKENKDNIGSRTTYYYDSTAYCRNKNEN